MTTLKKMQMPKSQRDERERERKRECARALERERELVICNIRVEKFVLPSSPPPQLLL